MQSRSLNHDELPKQATIPKFESQRSRVPEKHALALPPVYLAVPPGCLAMWPHADAEGPEPSPLWPVTAHTGVPPQRTSPSRQADVGQE